MNCKPGFININGQKAFNVCQKFRQIISVACIHAIPYLAPNVDIMALKLPLLATSNVWSLIIIYNMKTYITFFATSLLATRSYRQISFYIAHCFHLLGNQLIGVCDQISTMQPISE